MDYDKDFVEFMRELTGKDYKDMNTASLIEDKCEGHCVDAIVAKITYMLLQILKKEESRVDEMSSKLLGQYQTAFDSMLMTFDNLMRTKQQVLIDEVKSVEATDCIEDAMKDMKARTKTLVARSKSTISEMGNNANKIMSSLIFEGKSTIKKIASDNHGIVQALSNEVFQLVSVARQPIMDSEVCGHNKWGRWKVVKHSTVHCVQQRKCKKCGFSQLVKTQINSSKKAKN